MGMIDHFVDITLEKVKKNKNVFFYSHMQQTPNPEAQLPEAVPPNKHLYTVHVL
jgi:hypothetical protein